MLVAHPLPAITIRGIRRDVVPYVVEGTLDSSRAKVEIFSEHMTGLDFYLDPARIVVGTSQHVRKVLQQAIAALDQYPERARGTWCSSAMPTKWWSILHRPGTPSD